MYKNLFSGNTFIIIIRKRMDINMKKAIIILLLSLCLTACGKNDKNSGDMVNQSSSPKPTATATSKPTASPSGIINDAVNDTGDAIDDATDTVTDVIDDTSNGVNNMIDDVTDGVENAVDNITNDAENATSKMTGNQNHNKQ